MISVAPDTWRLGAAPACYAVVRGGRSLLVDCSRDDAGEALRAANLPPPDAVLHTQVADELCREWRALPETSVYVYEGCADLALRSERFEALCRTRWPLSREWDYRGYELYTLGGCLTERPPGRPLNVAGLLRPGEVFEWQDVRLEVLLLPGMGKRTLGLFWRERGILFLGNTLHAGGSVANLYDLERAYGVPWGYEELADSLRVVADLAPALALPAAGPVIADPAGDARTLIGRIGRLLDRPTRRRAEPPAMTNFAPQREFGRYRQIRPGLYQNTNGGNQIVFVEPDGAGLVIDPDICVWQSWEENCREVEGDLDLLEAETGLRRVELALVTHPHADHFEYADLFRKRYGTQIAAAPDVALLMEEPDQFPYVCLVPWFNLPFDRVAVDRRLPYDRPLRWRGAEITPFHTPGHCYAHTSFLIRWRDLRLIAAGDVLTYGQGPIAAQMPMPYSDAAWPGRGPLRTYRRMASLRPDLVLCTHSHAFFDPDGAILADWCAVCEEAEGLHRALIPSPDLEAAMTPPGFDVLRERLDAVCGRRAEETR